MLVRHHHRSCFVAAAFCLATAPFVSSAHAQVAPFPPTSPSGAAIIPPAALAIPEGMVHFESTESAAELQMRARDPSNGRLGGWAKLCESPCSFLGQPWAYYRVAGPGVRQSSPFMLRGEPASIVATPGSQGGWVSGLVLLILGSTVGGFGALVLAVDSLPSSAHENTLTAFTLIGVGGAIAVSEGVLMLDSRTDVVVMPWRNSSASTSLRFTGNGFTF